MASHYEGSTDELYAVTGGNPFLVTEALSVPGRRISAGVRDAVLARLARLGSGAREMAAAVAVIPGQAERWLLDEMTDRDGSALEECRSRGLLQYDELTAWYRHELVRGAVRDSLPLDRKMDLNARALAALVAADADISRIVHHARGAADRDAIARYAPHAARQASQASSHREALAHYRLAVNHADLLPPDERAHLLLDYAVEAYVMNEATEGLEPAQQALALWRSLGDAEREGLALRWLSRLHWWLGQSAEAKRFGRAAIDVLERLPSSTELPMAYSNLAQLDMLAQDAEPAIRWATKAIESARAIDDEDTLAHALNNLGSTRARAGDIGGLDLLRESLDVSLRHGLEHHAGRGYANLIWTLLDYRHYPDAARYLDEGLAYGIQRELSGSVYYMRAERARLRLVTGDWSGAEADVEWVMNRPEEPGITRMPALATRAQLHVRRGDADAAECLALARRLAEPTGELQRIVPVAVADAELAWLNGRAAEVVAAVSDAHAQAQRVGQPWIVDELAFWMWRGGAAVEPPPGSQTPYAAQMRGRWQQAAEEWQRIGCPYEQATALLDGATPEPLLAALEILDGLGARPAARLARRKLRGAGVASVPRGPRPDTRANPAGLTNRQVAVLRLLIAGLSNAEIADRLFVSRKTVGHHVSAILTKLEVSSRHEAAHKASELGLAEPAPGQASS
jgi:DNA-binding CsgD family transcriptional regulator/tetratricopeptide (TPR) repeat protein